MANSLFRKQDVRQELVVPNAKSAQQNSCGRVGRYIARAAETRLTRQNGARHPCVKRQKEGLYGDP